MATQHSGAPPRLVGEGEGAARGLGERRPRVYAEELSAEALLAPDVLSLVRAHDLELVVSVRPGSLVPACEALAALREEGVVAHPWPMLDDEHGRWASAETMARFAPFALGVLDRVAALFAKAGRSTQGARLVVDLEPPLFAMRELAAHRHPARAALAAGVFAARRLGATARHAEGLSQLAALGREARRRGFGLEAALAPLALPGPGGRALAPLLERLLGTPAPRGLFDVVTVMAYTSLFEGYARVDRPRARALLRLFARGCRERFGDAAAVALGCVGVGAFGDEAVLRSPDELCDDLALVRGEGVRDVALFDLGGVLGRPPAERWLAPLRSPRAPPRPLHDTWGPTGGAW